MKRLTQSIARRMLLICGLLLLLSCLLLGMIAWPATPSMQRAAAQGRWAARPFASYRIALRVEFLNQSCFQEIEVQGERVARIISDTCQTSSFSSLTTGRLFEISERVEQAPTCYADAEPCACRQLRLGKIDYDATLGYPHEIAYRRVVQPNWTHFDFWKRLWARRSLPSCALTRSTRIVVLSFVPIP
ncbi:MAG: hypothetical protein ACJ8CR_01655 [Roseiflexaceae bacterium]